MNEIDGVTAIPSAKVAELVEKGMATATFPLMVDLTIIRMKLADPDLPEHLDYWRRSYVRSLFALIEANVFMMKLQVLEAHDEGTVRLALGDEVLLREQGFRVGAKGVLKVTNKQFLSFEGNLTLTLRCFAAVRNPEFVLDTSGGGWAALKKSVAIRNRVTHPKTNKDLLVTDDDIATLNYGDDWFHDMQSRILFHNSTPSSIEVRIHMWQSIADNAEAFEALFECSADEIRLQMQQRIDKEKIVLKARSRIRNE